MAAFTITTPTNIDSLTAKTGGDTYTINGGALTIDQDSRYGLNNNTSASMGAITISGTLGGSVIIDGRFVRLIPFTDGSGTVPASNTVISRGSASGQLISVMASVTSAPLAAAAAMPATGFIKIKAWNSVPFTAGALTGITAVGSADTPGWLDIVGDEAGTLTVPRLGSWNVKGEWYSLGVTTGANTGTYQLPTAGLTTYCPGVFVETGVSSGVYEFYPNAGTVTALAANFSRDWRSKVCFITTAGVVRFGSDGTNTTGGFIPAAGLNVRVGNVFLHNATTAARTANVLPNATLATRYETLTTSAGVIDIDKASVGWYLNMAQAFSVKLTNVGVFDNITVSECASPLIWVSVGVGQSAAVANFAVLFSLNFAGGTLTDCTFTATSLAASGRYVISAADVSGFTFTNVRSFAFSARANATTGSYTLTRLAKCSFVNCTVGSGRVLLTTCTAVQWINTTYFDHPALNTTATNPMYLFDLASSSAGCTFDGVSFGGLFLTQPYNGIVNLGAAGCTDIRLLNLGTYLAPLSLGSPRVDDAAWTRATTTATVTAVGHTFVVGDTLYVVVSSDIAAIVVGAKTITAVAGNTFSFAALNAGATAGTVSFFGTKCANVFVLAAGAAANGLRVQRVYAPHTRTNLFTADNSSKNITLENVFSDYLNIPLYSTLNTKVKNVSGTPTLGVQTAVYGTHWWNGYTVDVANNTVNVPWTRVGTVVTVTSPGHSLRTTAASTSTVAQNIPISIFASSDEAAVPRGVQNFVTAINSSTFTITGINAGATSGTLSYRVGNGRIGLFMNEATVDTADQYTVDSGNPNFTSAGTLFMPNVGDQITFTSPDYILGQGSSFPIMELQIGGSTNTRYTTTYALDKNDGSGFGPFHNLYYERAGGAGTSGQSTFTVTDATGVEIADYVWGTGIANNAQVIDIVGNTITVDSPNIATVSGIIRFNHLPSESSLGPDTGIKMRWRIRTVTANAVGINFMYVFAESTDTGRAFQYPLDTVTLTIEARDAATGSPVAGARVYVTAAAGGNLPIGTVVLSGVTDSNGNLINSSYELTGSSQPVTGRVRKSTATPLYKTSQIAGTITAGGLNTTVFLVRDE